MNLLLTGADGQLGFELERALAPLGTLSVSTRNGRRPGGAHCAAIDLASASNIRASLDQLRPDVIVNPAAYTAVDRAESEPELANQVNAEAPAVIARWCAVHDALLIHYSTDYVFDGQANRPWREDDLTAPLGVYGASKRDGEDAIRASGCRHLILRTAWVYSSRATNFLRTMLRLGAERDELRVVADQRGTPTTARGLAEITHALLARHGAGMQSGLGTMHATHAGETSWHGFADAIFHTAVATGLLPRAPTLIAIATSEYPTPARRPAYSALDNSRLRDIHALALPEWKVGLHQVMAELAGR